MLSFIISQAKNEMSNSLHTRSITDNDNENVKTASNSCRTNGNNNNNNNNITTNALTKTTNNKKRKPKKAQS